MSLFLEICKNRDKFIKTRKLSYVNKFEDQDAQCESFGCTIYHQLIEFLFILSLQKLVNSLSLISVF